MAAKDRILKHFNILGCKYITMRHITVNDNAKAKANGKAKAKAKAKARPFNRVGVHRR
jgi:hypothetical protein